MTRRCSRASSVNTSRLGQVRPHARSACGAEAVGTEVAPVLVVVALVESGTEPFWPTRSYAVSLPPPSKGHKPGPLPRRRATNRDRSPRRRATNRGPPRDEGPRIVAFRRSTGHRSWPFDGQRAQNVAFRRSTGHRTWPFDGFTHRLWPFDG